MKEETKQKIADLKIATTTTAITFNNEQLGDEGAALLADALTGRQLTSLRLANCEITSEGFKLLAPIINASPDLRILDLSGLNVDLSLIQNPNVESPGKLIELNVTTNANFTREWNDINRLIDENPNLHTLILNKNPITAPQLQMLEQKKRDWKNLSLASCDLSLNDLKLFIPYEIKKPHSIRVQRNQFTKEDWRTEIMIARTALTVSDAQTQKISLLEAKINTLESQLGQIKSRDHFFNELLFIACKTGNYPLADIALQIGADLKAMDPETGQTALSISLEHENIDIAQMFYDKEPNVIHNKNKEGLSVIEWGVKNYKHDSVKWLWEAEKKLNISSEEKKLEYKKLYDLSTDEHRVFLAKDKLWDSVKIGQLEGLKDILEENELGIDINDMIHERDKETLLYKAVYYAHYELAYYLLSKGADYTIKSYAGIIVDERSREESAYQLALNKKNIKMITLFCSHELFKAISTKSSDRMIDALNVAKNMLGSSSSILGVFDFNQQTALHLAAGCPDPQFMETLLKNIPDNDLLLETSNAEGNTALHLAVEKQYAKNAQLLLTKGASIESKDTQGQIPLHKAVTSYVENDAASKEIIKNILKKHAECKLPINIKDHHNKTPILIAMNRGIEDLVEFIGDKFGAYKSKQKTKSITSFSSLLDAHGVFTNSETQEDKNTSTSDSNEELDTLYSIDK